jgi:hypothetical protein
LARVSFRAAKIVSCNKKKKFHGLRSKLPQLFFFSVGRVGTLTAAALPTE